MKRATAVLMIAAVVLSSMGAGAIVGAPIQDGPDGTLDGVDVNFVGCNEVELLGLELTSVTDADATLTLYNVSAGATESLTVDGNDLLDGDADEYDTLRLDLQDDLSLATVSGYELLGLTIGGESLRNPSDCGPTDAGDLSQVDLGLQCTDEGGDLTVENPNDVAVNVSINDRGPIQIGAGENTTFEGLDDGSYEVTTLYGGEAVGTKTVNIDCDGPSRVTLDLQCTAEGGDLTATNPNDVAVNVTVDGETRTVAPGANTTFEGLDDGSYEVETSAGGETISTVTVTVDCDGPSQVTLSLQCTDEGGDLTVENPNDVAVNVTVNDRGPIQIGAGENLTLEGLDDGSYEIETIVDGEAVGTKTVNIDCPDVGGVDVDVQCGVDGATVTVSNENDVAVDVDVGGRTLTLAPGENQTYTGVQNNEFDVTTSVDGTTVATETVVVDCLTDSEVSVEVVCGADGANATVTNPNDVPVTIEVSGDASLTETIEAGGTLTFENVPDGEYNVTTIVGGEVISTQTVVVDCADDGDNGDGDAGDGDAGDGDNGDGDAGDGDSGDGDAGDGDAGDGDTGDGDDGDGDAGDGDDGDAGDGDAGDGDSGDGDAGDGEMPAYQIDVAAGQVIENLGADEDAFYGTQGRLLQAQTVLADGTVTGSYNVPTGEVTKDLAGCAVSYDPVSYDGETGEVTLSVSVADGADCEGVTLTLAGYELPGDDTTFVRANADGQELVDYETVTLGAGESGTVTIDLDG
ncbi:hypothetical protein [Halomarina rubra]|uniref:Uncharacterized protein n=1 Tax=Halomarina rubra TaxID=2071873 RepID=A0ABD6AW07_9EURY|nr:hypothetical protein [Halomarina rubra]